MLQLIFNNEPLADDRRTLESYGVGAGSEVVAMAKVAEAVPGGQDACGGKGAEAPLWSVFEAPPPPYEGP